MTFAKGEGMYRNLYRLTSPNNLVMIPQEERRITIPEDVYIGLDVMAANERKKTPNEVIKAMITPKSLAQKILATSVKRKVVP